MNAQTEGCDVARQSPMTAHLEQLDIVINNLEGLHHRINNVNRSLYGQANRIEKEREVGQLDPPVRTELPMVEAVAARVESLHQLVDQAHGDFSRLDDFV